MKANETTSAPAPSGVSRRTVVKGAAWAVPVVAVASAVPAMAASPCEPVITFGGLSCKCPGQSTGDPWTYYLQFCATLDPNCTGGTVSITAVNSKTGGPGGTPLGTPDGSPYPILVPAGELCSQTYKFTSANSANFILITYTYDGGSEMTIELASPPDCTDCATRV